MKKIPLSQGLWSLVDDEEYDRVNEYTWSAAKIGNVWYAVTSIEERQSFLHNFIMGGTGVDHIDNDGLDNRKSNLRFATVSQNAMNRRKRSGYFSSDYKGVVEYRGKWRAQITKDGHRYWLGDFLLEKDAAEAYDKAALEYFGEFARLNFSLN